MKQKTMNATGGLLNTVHLSYVGWKISTTSKYGSNFEMLSPANESLCKRKRFVWCGYS